MAKLTKTENMACWGISCYIILIVWIAFLTHGCQHTWIAGASMDRCKQIAEGSSLPYPRYFYKCTECDEVSITSIQRKRGK